MKKKLLIGICIAAVAVCAVVAFLVFKPKKEEPKPAETPKVTIKFDVDGGEAVEDLKVEKGKTAELPSTTKENFLFEGWYLDEEEITSEYVFEKDVTLKARWKEVTEDVKTFKVSYDSKGGSAVKSTTVECGKSLKLPANPTKDGYTFKAWEDKNGKVILNGALLSCENVKLYAIWDKVEEKKEEPASKTEPEKEKTYSCPDGYTLKDTKCIKEVDAVKSCSSNSNIEYFLIGNYCYYGKRDVIRCNAGGKWAYSNTDHENRCFYDESDEYMKESSCTAAGRYWIGGLCYATKEKAANKCDIPTAYYIDAHQIPGYGTKPGIVDACYFRTNSHYECEDSSYTLKDNKCTKTIDATYA
jgi:uncharacterized repeat protein (TIGR02543 family)